MQLGLFARLDSDHPRVSSLRDRLEDSVRPSRARTAKRLLFFPRSSSWEAASYWEASVSRPQIAVLYSFLHNHNALAMSCTASLWCSLPDLISWKPDYELGQVAETNRLSHPRVLGLSRKHIKYGRTASGRWNCHRPSWPSCL
jgi:hypothetical protein